MSPPEEGPLSGDVAEEKIRLTPLVRFRVPVGGQEIELQQLDYVHGGISLLRLRIREGKRFTVFDLDPVSARVWSEAMLRWAEAQGQGSTQGLAQSPPPAGDGK